MATCYRKTYADAVTYKKYPEYEKNILDFIMSSERIDKESDRFHWVIEDVKRMQSTAVISRVLAMDNVVLCMHRRELPKALKVFVASDIKQGRDPKVFIDVTGLMEIKDGFYRCRKIDTLCTYLLAAAMMAVYHAEPERILRNSVLVNTSTACYVSMFTHVLDYLRVSGFAENRIKISYIVAMFFMCSMLGLDRNETTKNIAIKIAKGDRKNIHAYEYYYNEEDFQNIETFVSVLAETFKLKGLTADVFLERWVWQYGQGTQFGAELFVPFSKVLTDAYCGSYVNHHQTIEKCCGRDMVTYTTSLIRICSETIDRGMKYESSLDRDVNNMIYGKTILQESLFNGNKELKQAMMLDDVLNNPPAIEKRFKLIASLCKDQKQIDKQIHKAWFIILSNEDPYYYGQKSGLRPAASTMAKVIKSVCSMEERQKIAESHRKGIINMKKLHGEKREGFDLKALAKGIEDAEKAVKILG